ncbi:hypothetical protein VH569_11280 [Azospirillum sp. 11R-A]
MVEELAEAEKLARTAEVVKRMLATPAKPKQERKPKACSGEGKA